MKKNLLIMTTLLFCGLGVFTACSDLKDNPAIVSPASDNRAVFEQQFSKDLQAMADEFRFDAAIQTTASLKEFINVLDEKALASKVLDIAIEMTKGLGQVNLADLSSEEQAAIRNSVRGRFGLTDKEVDLLSTIFTVDAYKSLGKLKMEFKDGLCTITSDADAFTIVNTNSKGETKTIALSFNDERDGISFFIGNLGYPLAIQLPKSINITLTTPQGKIVNGVVNLTTVAEGQSKYISFKNSGWMADVKLNANVNSRQEGVSLYVKHTDKGAFDLKAAFDIQGKEMARLEINDMHDAYTDEEIESETFKELRDMGPFFSGAYDVLKALKGKSVDKVVITINDNMVVDGKVDDIAKSLLALGNVRKLYGTKPGKETIDKYTQELNGLIHFTVSQKNTGIAAQGTLMTAQKELKDGEYQPVLALQFKGEKEAQMMYSRMSQTDMANYKAMFQNFSPLVNEISETLIVARKKGEAIIDAVKGYFGSSK